MASEFCIFTASKKASHRYRWIRPCRRCWGESIWVPAPPWSAPSREALGGGPATLAGSSWRRSESRHHLKTNTGMKILKKLIFTLLNRLPHMNYAILWKIINNMKKYLAQKGIIFFSMGYLESPWVRFLRFLCCSVYFLELHGWSLISSSSAAAAAVKI